MGCSSSVARSRGCNLSRDLERSTLELTEERKRLQERDAQVAQVHARLMEQIRGTEESANMDNAARSVQELRVELQARQMSHALALEQQKESFTEQHAHELKSIAMEHDTAVAQELEKHAALAEQEAAANTMAAQEVHEELMQRLQETTQEKARKILSEAEAAEREAQELRAQLGPLQNERASAAAALFEANEQLQAERALAAGRSVLLEQRLADAQDEKRRSEQRSADIEAHFQTQLGDLRSELRQRTQELQERDDAIHQRDAELSTLGQQLVDLQSLFGDVNQQLQAECTRIEKMQGNVSACANQSRELQKLEAMLEESHRMLGEVRDALEHERSERARTTELLEHEQQRTQLLLEVLKQFKEKLQGLTPQMLLSRLAALDPKAAANAATGVAAVIDGKPSPEATNPILDFPTPVQPGSSRSSARDGASTTAPGDVLRTPPGPGTARPVPSRLAPPPFTAPGRCATTASSMACDPTASTLPCPKGTAPSGPAALTLPRCPWDVRCQQTTGVRMLGQDTSGMRPEAASGETVMAGPEKERVHQSLSVCEPIEYLATIA